MGLFLWRTAASARFTSAIGQKTAKFSIYPIQRNPRAYYAILATYP
jgi:hypothetical protein